MPDGHRLDRVGHSLSPAATAETGPADHLGLSRYPEAWNHRKFLESVLKILESVDMPVQTPVNR